MKRLLLILSCCMLLALNADARTNPYVIGSSSGGYVLKDSYEGDVTEGGFGRDMVSDRYCMTGGFTTTSAYTVKKLSVEINNTLSGTQNLTISICDDESNNGCVNGDSTIDLSAFTDTRWVDVYFTTGKALSDATVYYIRLKPDAVHATAYPQWTYNNTGDRRIQTYVTSSCTTAESFDSNAFATFRTYAYE